ncbi:hypothetical protein ACVWYG_001197 [Pedobacter sp. UYEF25]
MKKYIIYIATLTMTMGSFVSCTKIQDGFISPTIQYSPSLLVIKKGQTGASNGLVPDGSSLPLQVRWVHIYDATGKIVDDFFNKTYKVGVWTKAYDPKTDITFAAIAAKRTIADLQPIIVNPSSGVIEANSASFNIPTGSYTMDIEVKNQVGTQLLKNAMALQFVDAAAIELAPESGVFAAGRAVAGTSKVTYFFNGDKNPFVSYSINRIGDAPNTFSLKFVDRNGVAFNPKTGEVIKRPAAGLDPQPPFLQNLQDYAPDTYQATDDAIKIEYPLVPFPIASLGNGFNMYYHIKTTAVKIDSTNAWTSNPNGEFYKGTADPRYLGTYLLGEFDYSIRVPMRIKIPGNYELTIKILNVVHR